MNYLLVYLNCLTATNNMTLAYSLANPPQAPEKASGKQPTEDIGHVPSGQTMPTGPNKRRKRSSSVVRNLGWVFDALGKPVKKTLEF